MTRGLLVASIVVLVGAGPAPKAKPVRHATGAEIQALLDNPASLTGDFGADLRSFPPGAKAVFLKRSAKAAIARVEREAKLSRQDAADLLLAVLLPTYVRESTLSGVSQATVDARRRALFESVLAHAPKSLVAADAFGRFVANQHCGLAKREDRIAALRTLPGPLREYWTGLDYEYDGAYAAAEPHYRAAAKAGGPLADRARFHLARAACKIHQFELCLSAIEATHEDNRVGGAVVQPSDYLVAHRAWWRGKALAGLGREEEARAAFEDVLGVSDPRLDPNLSDEAASKGAPRKSPRWLHQLVCAVGETYAHEKRWKAAKTLITRGRCPGGVGGLEFAQGHYFDALVAWQQPVPGDEYLDHVRALAKLGAIQAAREMIGRYFDACQRPDSRSAYDCPAVAALEKELGAGDKAAATAPSPVLRRLEAPRLARWREVPIPKGARPIPLLPPPPALAGRSIVFTASKGDRVIAVSVSGELDPRGEVSRGGYWVHLSNDAGKHFERPLYLGFAEGYPYYVVTAPRIAPFGKGVLRIEVQRREIDDAHLMFPPIAMRLKSKRDDIYIEVPLAKLERDTDGDGLTDLVEEKLCTDPRSKDTDGDGLPDAVDPQPLLAKTSKDTLTDQVTAAALSDIVFSGVPALYIDARARGSIAAAAGRSDLAAEGREGNAPQRTLFVRSAVPLLASRALPERTIVLTPDEAHAYRKKFGFTAFLDVVVVFDPAKKRALVKYDFGWKGGSVLATRTKTGWVVTMIDSWIT